MKKLMMMIGLTFGLMAGGDISPVVPVEVNTNTFTPYFGGGVSYTVDGKDFYGVVLGGVEYNQYIGIEGRYYSRGKHYDDVLGLYLKPEYVFGNGVGVYGLAGVERSWVKDSIRYRCHTLETTNTVDSWAAGGGVEYKGVFLDGVYNDKLNDTRVTLGYRFRF